MIKSCRIYSFILLAAIVLYAASADGAVMKVMETKHLNDIAADGGYLWIATDGGAVKYNTADGTHELFTTAEGLVSNLVNAVAVDAGGTVWFATYEGITSFDGETWSTYSKALGSQPYNDQIVDVASGSDGMMYFASLGGGLLTFDGESWNRYATYNGLTNNYVNTMVFCDDCMWIGTQEGISQIFDGGFTKYNALEGNDEATVEAIAPGYGTAVWMATWGGGLTCLRDSMWRTLTVDDGLQSNYINTVTVDQWGVKWIGTLGTGLTSISGSTMKTYEEIDGTPLVDVRAVAVDGNNVKWIGTADGSIWKIDIERPEAPAGLTAGYLSDGEAPAVLLQWTLSPGDGNLAGYQIYRSAQDTFTEPFPPDSLAGDDTRFEMEQSTSILIASVPAGTTEFQDAVDLAEGEYYYWVSAADDGIESEPVPAAVTVLPFVSVDEEPQGQFFLGNARPNPFNPATTIDFTVPAECYVTLSVYNVGGQLVDVLHDGMTGAGTHSVIWNADGKPSGLYFYRFGTGSFSSTGKMLLLK